MEFEPDEDEDEDSNQKKRKKKSPIYEDRIRSMCASNHASLEVSYMHLMEKVPTLAMWSRWLMLVMLPSPMALTLRGSKEEDSCELQLK